MKKLLSILLAVTMLAAMGTMAFAADYVPGDDIELANADFESTADSSNPTKRINSDNFSVSKVSWTEGKALVSSVKIDNDEDCVYVTLKQDYTLTKAKDLVGTITIREKSTSNYYEAYVNTTVAYSLDDTTLYFSATDSEESIDAMNSVTKETIYKVDADKGSGMLLLTGDEFEVSVRVYDGDKHYLYADTKANKTVLTAYSDTNADINFINFKGTPTFSANATISFYDLEKTDYVYILKDGKLTASGAKWNADSGAWEVKTRTLGTFVTSDVKLSVASTSTGSSDTTDGTTGTYIPDTGANDVVGIAAALAAVALISAAAVSLKK